MNLTELMLNTHAGKRTNNATELSEIKLYGALCAVFLRVPEAEKNRKTLRRRFTRENK